jgi:hypothetical protein
LMPRASHQSLSIAAPIRDVMDVTGSDASKHRIGELYTEPSGLLRAPLAARDRRQRVSLNTLLSRIS